ncbi:MAG: hypothetical protein LUE96_11215 [Lachnospiraceae bacterium]|nr:hypothetical protein [Lachnospiraceae bacterium]
MCNIGIVVGDAGVKMPTGILFINFNKSERNIRKKVVKIREKCISHGIILGQDVIINKGPDRDIDRDAVNMLISFLLDGEYQMIVVDKLTDITPDLSDLEEFLSDAAAIGVNVFELSTMKVRHHVYMEDCPECSPIGNIIRMWS